MKVSPYLTRIDNTPGAIIKDDSGTTVFIPLDNILHVSERLTAIHHQYQEEP